LQHYTIPTLAIIVSLIALYLFGVRTIRGQLRSRFQPASTKVADEVTSEKRDLVEV